MATLKINKMKKRIINIMLNRVFESKGCYCNSPCLLYNPDYFKVKLFLIPVSEFPPVMISNSPGSSTNKPSLL